MDNKKAAEVRKGHKGRENLNSAKCVAYVIQLFIGSKAYVYLALTFLFIYYVQCMVSRVTGLFITQ